MRFGKIDNFIWFGSGHLLYSSVLALKKKNYGVAVFSGDRHLHEVIDARGQTLAQALGKGNIDYFSSPDINRDERLFQYVNPTTLGIAMGPAWIFRTPVCRMFGERLVNFMGINLPRYRGGAHYTWQILQGNRMGSVNMQLINEVVDSGAVIKHREYLFPSAARIPQDYSVVAANMEKEFMAEFLEEVKRNHDFTVQPLQEKFSQYFPYLSTIKQGYINWSWPVAEIEQFVCAFDDPYPGASTVIDGRRVFLHHCHVEYQDGAFHPFLAGIIYHKSPDALFIASRGGALVVRRVLDEEGQDITQSLKLGHRFYTPRDLLDEAMEFRAVYVSKGLKS